MRNKLPQVSKFLNLPLLRGSKLSGLKSHGSLYSQNLNSSGGSPFKKFTPKISKLAFVASASALALTGIYANLSDESKYTVETEVDDFMKSYGNTFFLHLNSNEMFREYIQKLREAEFLYHGLVFDENKNTVFYRGMYTPEHVDDTDLEQVKSWQNDIIRMSRDAGFSPLLWLTRPSATRERGLNIHPHDGNVARRGAADAPPSWSACVMAMTCSFDIVKGYCGLQNPVQTGCIALVSPKKSLFLSSTDIKSRHTANVGHEYEVIAPNIDTTDVIALAFVTEGKVSRVEINSNVIARLNNPKEYTIDIQLVDELKKLLANALPEARDNLVSLINMMEAQQNKVDLKSEFESKFNDTVEELIEHTIDVYERCSQKISDTPGFLGLVLRNVTLPRGVLSKEEIAEKLLVDLDLQPDTAESSSLGSGNKAST